MGRSVILSSIVGGLTIAVLSLAAVDVQAQMLANVAAAKTTSGTDPWSVTYATAKAVDEQLRSVTGYVSAKNTENAWWEVDLGAEFDFDQITVYCRRQYDVTYPDAGAHINGAYLCAYDDFHAEIATQVLSGYKWTSTVSTRVWIQDWDNAGSGWTGVRYFAVEDRDGVLNAEAAGGALWLNELQARSEIPTYPTYITNVTASGNMLYSNGTHADVQYELMVNGSGMSDQTGLPGEMLFGDPNAMAREIHGGQWTSGAVSTELPYVIYDLGGSCELDRMFVWNRNAPNLQDNGVKDVLISTSPDGVTYTELPDDNGELAEGNYTINMSPGGNAGYQADIDLTGVTARYVKLLALTSWGGTENDWGISEVRFYGDRTMVRIPGDSNNSGTVDEADAKVLAANWGASGKSIGWTHGDFNGDQKVDAADAAILAAQWGYGLTSESASAVPEPNTLLLLVSLLTASFLGRRSR